MIMRRFSSNGDVDRAWQYVLQVRSTVLRYQTNTAFLDYRSHTDWCILVLFFKEVF